MPADEEQILRFIAYSHAQRLSPATINVYLSGVASLHNMQGLQAPSIGSYRIKLALKSIAEAGPGINKKAPITYQLLCYMIQQLHPDLCLLWSAMFCLGFYGALRGSEYTALVEHGTIRAPLISDLTFTYHQQSLAMVYTIRKSKTTRVPIQVPIGCSRTNCCAVCTMKSYLVLRDEQGTLHADAYLFVDQAGLLPSSSLIWR